MSSTTPNEYPKTGLALSAAPDLLPEDAQAASVIERELASGDLAAIDRVIDYVWPDGLSDDVGTITIQATRDSILSIRAERDAPIITESELRLLDGNR